MNMVFCVRFQQGKQKRQSKTAGAEIALRN
jgi:hypothetical protein